MTLTNLFTMGFAVDFLFGQNLIAVLHIPLMISRLASVRVSRLSWLFEALAAVIPMIYPLRFDSRLTVGHISLMVALFVSHCFLRL